MKFEIEPQDVTGGHEKKDDGANKHPIPVQKNFGILGTGNALCERVPPYPRLAIKVEGGRRLLPLPKGHIMGLRSLRKDAGLTIVVFILPQEGTVFK